MANDALRYLPAYYRDLKEGSVERHAADRATALYEQPGDVGDEFPTEWVELLLLDAQLKQSVAQAGAREFRVKIAEASKDLMRYADRGALAAVSNKKLHGEALRASASAMQLARFFNTVWLQSGRRNPAEAERTARMADLYQRMVRAMAQGVMQYGSISEEIEINKLVPSWSKELGWDRNVFAWPDVSLALLSYELAEIASKDAWVGVPSAKRHVDPVRTKFIKRLAEIWHGVTGTNAYVHAPDSTHPEERRTGFHYFVAALWGHMMGIEYGPNLQAARGDFETANKLWDARACLGKVPSRRMLERDLDA